MSSIQCRWPIRVQFFTVIFLSLSSSWKQIKNHNRAKALPFLCSVFLVLPTYKQGNLAKIKKMQKEKVVNQSILKLFDISEKKAALYSDWQKRFQFESVYLVIYVFHLASQSFGKQMTKRAVFCFSFYLWILRTQNACFNQVANGALTISLKSFPRNWEAGGAFGDRVIYCYPPKSTLLPSGTEKRHKPPSTLWKLYYPLDGTIKSLLKDKSSRVSQNSQVCSSQESKYCTESSTHH